jgi:hypothetical protein
LLSVSALLAHIKTSTQVTYSPDMGEVQEYFLGSGGLINLYCSLTGEAMPGLTEAVAQVGFGGVWVLGRGFWGPDQPVLQPHGRGDAGAD